VTEASGAPAKHDYDVLVVGSGFGGSVAALRLTEKSYRVGVLEAAHAARVGVPDELSVIGFDDVELARYVGLTTVSQPLESSGAQGAQLLMEAMRGAPRRTSRLDLRIVRRSTTASRGRSAAGRMQKPPARGRRNSRARMASA